MKLPFEKTDSRQEKQAKFLLDTLNYYSPNPKATRSVDFGRECMYRSAQGQKCAIGRFIPEENYSIFLENKTVGEIMDKTEIGELGRYFLIQCQSFHDGEYYWDLENGGLSEEGKEKLKEIISDFELNEKYFSL